VADPPLRTGRQLRMASAVPEGLSNKDMPRPSATLIRRRTASNALSGAYSSSLTLTMRTASP
jgi:hypothetical protein